jgi:hypothetical protein
MNWKTEAGPLEICEMPAKTALEFALQLTDEGKVHGAVLNPFHPTGFKLTGSEIRSLLKRDLNQYLDSQPIRPGEHFITREPTRPLPSELLQALDAFVAITPEIQRYHFLEVVSAERERPILLLTINIKQKVDEQSLVHKLTTVLEGKLSSPYEYLDIRFESKR